MANVSNALLQSKLRGITCRIKSIAVKFIKNFVISNNVGNQLPDLITGFRI